MQHAIPELQESCHAFLRDYYRGDILELAENYPRDRRSLWIDWQDLYRYDAELADDVLEFPETVVDALNAALSEFDLPVDVGLTDATIRLHGLVTENYGVEETRSEHINQYLAVNGQVAKTSPVHPKYQEVSFECQRCGGVMRIPQAGTDIQEPYECNSCERQGPFKIDQEASEFIDHQLVRIQEPPERSKGMEGEYIDVHLEDDIVGKVRPGDRVDMHGIYRVRTPDNGITARPFIEGHAPEIQQTDFEEIDVAPYIDEIRAIASGKRGSPYRKLIDSIAPKVFGYDDVKEAIALQMFGGWRHDNPDGTMDRGDSHIFLVGDPGSGKSTILRAVEDLAPRAVFTEGKGLTKAGATAAATRDDFGDTEWGLEAGVMVLANKGIACIDELDKVDDSAKESLHGALESQRVNINKAGINATLPAQTALLAAGNPTYGRFDKHQPIAEQIDLSPTLISRFDLIFIFQDEPDESRDEQIAEHIVNARQTTGRLNQGEDVDDEARALIEPALDRDLLRAYIAHAKQHVYPTIRDDEVKQRLVDFYTGLRSVGDSDFQEDNPVPVTARSLDAIQRLAEASARIRLSNEIEEQDVERATRLVQKTMREVGMDAETGQFDVDVIETGTSQTQRDRIKTVKSLIKEVGAEYEEGAPIEEIEDRAADAGIEQSKVEHEIKNLLDRGEAWAPSEGYVRLS